MLKNGAEITFLEDGEVNIADLILILNHFTEVF